MSAVEAREYGIVGTIISSSADLPRCLLVAQKQGHRDRQSAHLEVLEHRHAHAGPRVSQDVAMVGREMALQALKIGVADAVGR
jgi:hypothetical protein